MPKLTFTQPPDRSLEAYKTWIRNMMAAIGGEETMTEAEWEAAWREFWSDEEPAKPAKK